MEFLAENHSLFPRVGATDDELRLRRAYHDYDSGEIDEGELKQIEDSYAEDVIGEQIDAGLDIVTDGMIRWYGHISHIAEKLTGTEVGGLVRYFDTNYLVREAKVVEPIEWRDPLIEGEFELAESVSSQPVKMMLPGPLTFARHSILENGVYSNEQQLAEDYTNALQQEIRNLSEAGCKHLQIDEPSLLQSPGEAEWVLPLLDELAQAAGDCTTRLATYFGDAVPLYEDLQETDFNVLMFDFTYSETLAEDIAGLGSDKRLGLGLLNGRNTKLRDSDEIIDEIERMQPGFNEKDQILTFSCSIDYLPRNKARRKLERLAEIRDRLMEGVAQV
jgi:5-methyltetrahydropteroyltriglutamate--homocysteine methyltransferase